jgi:hypothetical protein
LQASVILIDFPFKDQSQSNSSPPGEAVSYCDSGVIYIVININHRQSKYTLDPNEPYFEK